MTREAYAMTPAPSLKQQEIVSNFHIRLKADPQNRCYTAISPTDVVLDDFNVVQPDVFVVCDELLKLAALPDITINLWEIFARQRPQENGAI